MISSIFELFLTFGFGVFVAGFAFYFARKSLTANDDIILTREDSKLKDKNSKQPVKVVKPIKKTVTNAKQKSVVKTKSTPTLDSVNVVVSKTLGTAKETTETTPAPAVERIRIDSTAEWTKVIKPAKKPKKESKLPEIDNSSNDDVKVPIKENTVKEVPKPVSVAEKETAQKQKKDLSQVKPETVIEKVSEKSADQAKTVKSKKSVTIDDELASKEVKTPTVNVEVKPKASSDDGEELKQKLRDMMNELEKIKTKDESKTNNQTNKEIELLKQKLKNSQANEDKLLEDLKKKGQAVTDLKNQFLIIQSELTKNIVSHQSLTREKLSMENRLRTLEDQNIIMNEKCQHIEKMSMDNENLIHNLTTMEQELKTVKHECNEILKSREMEITSQMNGFQSERQRLQDQLVRVQTDLIENNSKMQSFQQELLTAKNTHSDLLTENMRLQKSLGDLKQSTMLAKQQELADFDNKTKQQEDLIACLRNQINDISTINTSLSEQKTDLEREIDRIQQSQSVTNNSEIDELKEQLAGLQQDIIGTKNQLSVSEIGANECKSACEAQLSQLKELTTERDNLVALVDQYKTGLESTELILSKLQTSVNEEESKWRESLVKSETEAEKSKKELEIVYNDLMRIRNSRAEKSELNFAYHCVDKSLSSLIDEMEARMIHFERSLETVVQERDNALAQMSSQINGLSGKHGNHHGHEEHDEHDEQAFDGRTSAELDKLNSDLNNQVELNKTLENQCNKYRSLIEIGKDALREEQARVRQLQEELNNLQSSCTNVEIPLNSNSF